jgi:hypothetical protein
MERPRALLLVLFIGACGGGSPPAESGAAASSERTGASPEQAVQLCHDRGGPRRTDYAYIAGYRCPDGSMPLGLDVARGAAARVGNVGAGPDGHVLDLYEVPCPGGPVRVYVDAYHCGDRSVDIDPQNLSPLQLAHIARQARALEGVPFDPRAAELRESMTEWVRQSPQVRLRACPAVLEAVVHRDYAYGRLIFMQMVISMAAATIEGSQRPDDAPVDPVRVEIEGVLGALRLHDAIVAQRGDGAADPALVELVRRRDEGGLEQHVRELSARCDSPPTSTGLMMSTDEGGNVWPPSGPDCERLVRCCEGHGLVRGGAAVTGTPGLMCLLAASPPDVDCAAGISMLAAQGVTCD